ncbi:DNA mismatch repair protein MutL [Moraxella osloensis]|uniref:DNA mismatch repair protein MutL n=1 Tax=Faucicola osloensis TaxID=34062 RepID=A0AA91J8U1_FAUOS|nr:DNA mismatch repair endonuclease MutL [Moraxella osloensis]OBX62072.1 DNA mismatch repair protein MutL [Moraxella osloensis]
MPDNRIHKLSPLLINQIAAGEVVTRPASVVKELIENAIDANATHIRIDIEQGGLGLIQISDNGIGIHPDDMTLAVTRHATSKLANVSELVGIHSLGFRGEALASIAAISHLTLTSSHNDSGIGQQLSVSGSEVSQATIRPIVKHRGTCVSVRDLYFNVPGRRSHLKSIATEFAHIEQVVQRLAISFADVQIELYHQDKLRFSLTQSAQASHQNLEDAALPFLPAFSLARLEQALNLPLADIAQPFYLSLQGLQAQAADLSAQVTGWFFIAHKNNLPKLIYINHRLVSDLAISQALQKVGRKLGIGIDNLLQMGYALSFELPAEWINVNIHPSKQQVKIQPLTNILAWLSQHMLAQLPPKMTALKNLQRQACMTNTDDSNVDKFQNLPAGEAASIQYINSNDKPTNHITHVAENQSIYQVATKGAVDRLTDSDSIQLVTLFENKHEFENKNQTFALIFWQRYFYLIDLQYHHIDSDDKAYVQSYLNQADFTHIADSAIQVSETDMLQWLLSHSHLPNSQSSQQSPE